jgi:hypothetical protein
MSLETAIARLNVVVGALAGLRRCYADPPESISEFPCGMTYIESGTYTDSAAGGYGIHTLIVDIYESRTVMQQAVNAAKPWPDKMRTALRADLTLAATVSHVGDAQMFFRYRAGPMLYNDITHYGVRFWIPVKVNYV